MSKEVDDEEARKARNVAKSRLYPPPLPRNSFRAGQAVSVTRREEELKFIFGPPIPLCDVASLHRDGLG